MTEYGPNMSEYLPICLDISEYVGSCVVQAIPGKGRGLVASENLEPGTLILCSKALVSTRGATARTELANAFTDQDPSDSGSDKNSSDENVSYNETIETLTT